MDDLKYFIDKYLSLGMAVIPLRKSTKIPLVKWKSFMEEAPSEAQAHEWFTKYPAANIAALMGRVSGNILSVDVDFRNGGEKSIKLLELPETFTSRTGGGGYHFLYRSAAACQSKIGIFPGIDLIAEGGYCVMPPSLHKSGARYEIYKDLPISSAPEWLTAILPAKTGHPNSPAVPSPSIPVGRRHNSVMKILPVYADESFYLTHLWKRAYGLAANCCELPVDAPFTVGELFNLCLWAWNKTHPHDQFHAQTAWKLLAGAAKKRHDICFGRMNAPIPPLLLNIPKKKQPNYPTTQSESVSDTGTYIIQEENEHGKETSDEHRRAVRLSGNAQRVDIHDGVPGEDPAGMRGEARQGFEV